MQNTEARYGDRKFKAHLLGVLIWLIVHATLCECNTITGRLPETSLITNFVQRFIHPYIQSLQYTDNNPPHKYQESPATRAIYEVIEELRPYLQDEDDEYDKAVGGSSETTIIEYLPRPHYKLLRIEKEPSSELQASIRKYEKMKADIKAALEREKVADKTKQMVTRTLDELVAQVIGNKCTWKTMNPSLALFRNGKDAKHNITVTEWEELKSQYFNFLERKHSNKSLNLFNDFHKFFSKVINDTQNLSQIYKIKCQLVKADSDNTTRANKNERAHDSCEEFKICSEELKDFLLDFYKSLNDTVVSVFKNYAAMYVKDVVTTSEDTKEVDSVPSVLNDMGNAVDRRVTKVFIQELGKIKLDKNKNRETNIKLLREFIRTTCKRVQKHVKKHFATDLVSLRTRLFLTVKQDINMNLGVDLGNLEADIKGRVCTVFLTCNSRVLHNRRAISESGTPNLKRNSVYVKVQLTLNDKLKDAMIQTKDAFFRSRINKYPNTTLRKNHQEFRKYGELNATRTTVKVDSATKSVDSNLSSIKNVFNNSVFEMF